jgi:TonB family protein
LGLLRFLSDTQGVDFGPYLKDVVKAVRENWYRLIPEEARPPVSKKGNLAIEFAIIRDGNIANVKLVSSSGYASLDRAAWAGITASNPLPRLPLEFKGDSLALRFHFYYNPDPADLAGADPAPNVPVVVHAVAGTTPEKSSDATVSSDAALPTLCFPPPKTQTRVEAEAVGDQNGVDFSPYLEASVLPILRANWYRLP